MIKVKGNEIHVTRADAGTLELAFEETYGCTDASTPFFKIYEKEGLDLEPLLEISAKTTSTDTQYVSVDLAGKIATIVLDSDSTNIGAIENEVTEYWYELKLDVDTTTLGFDESGAKKLYLYPSGKDKTVK